MRDYKEEPLMSHEAVMFAVYEKDTGEIFSAGRCNAQHLNIQAESWENSTVSAYLPATLPPKQRFNTIDVETKRILDKNTGELANDAEHIPF